MNEAYPYRRENIFLLTWHTLIDTTTSFAETHLDWCDIMQLYWLARVQLFHPTNWFATIKASRPEHPAKMDESQLTWSETLRIILRWKEGIRRYIWTKLWILFDSIVVNFGTCLDLYCIQRDAFIYSQKREVRWYTRNNSKTLFNSTTGSFMTCLDPWIVA